MKTISPSAFDLCAFVGVCFCTVYVAGEVLWKVQVLGSDFFFIYIHGWEVLLCWSAGQWESFSETV